MFSYFMYVRITVDDHTYHESLVIQVDDRILTADNMWDVEKQLIGTLRYQDNTLSVLDSCGHKVSLVVESMTYLGRSD